MKICPCLSFIPFLWGQVYRLFAANRTTEETPPLDIIADIGSTLPSDIVADIGSRLPAQSVKSLCSLTKTPYFVNMHFRRAMPVIAYQYYCDSARKKGLVICAVEIHFGNEETQKIVKKTIRVDFRGTSPEGFSMPLLYGSYNGFLLFRNVDHDPVLFIHNPVTEEEVSIIAGNPTFRPCGFFFNPTSEEYKALFIRDEKAGFRFMEYGLRTKSTRVFTNLSHPPNLYSSPTIFNGALHWMVNDNKYKGVFGAYPFCSDSIVVFNIESGKFCTMAHPGYRCKVFGMHYTMGLTEMEGHLCYCGVSKAEIVLWTLENYELRVWVKRYVVDTIPMYKKCYISSGHSALPIHMYGDELLLRLNVSDLFLYNVRSGTFRRVGYRGVDLGYSHLSYYMYAYAHFNTLVTLSGRVG